MSGRFLVGLVLPLFIVAAAAADEPKLPDAKEFDKQLVESLKNVHNVGAELYNSRRDYAGAYRMYEGALLALRPLLAHRPAAQKLIDEGLATAEIEPSMGLKAFKLHETIESVRTTLKGVAVTKPAEPKKTTETKTTETKPTETKPAETKPTTKPVPETKAAETKKPEPAPQYELAPLPREKKTTGSKPSGM